MKNSFLLLLFAISLSAGYSQTATNFTCKDCSGIEHDLFTELESGKVIVLDWVMPCGPCAGPTLTTYNVVQSYQATHPGKVFMYVVDDFADTPCVSLASWLQGIGATNVTVFSNTAIDMMDYGSYGMPKVVVIGGSQHQVFYDANNSVNAELLIAAIDSAIAVSSVGVDDLGLNSVQMSVHPNPSPGNFTIDFSLDKDLPVMIEILDVGGKLIETRNFGVMNSGSNTLVITTKLPSGLYFVRLNADHQSSGLVKLFIQN